jgi:hypothetical protein
MNGRTLGVMLLGALLAACGTSDMSGPEVGQTSGTSGSGGTTTSGCGSSSCGSAIVTLTDAPGDLLSYVVSVDSLQLKTASGASVEALPMATQVDFAQLVDLTELVAAGQIPAAEYVSASITLDYTNASITAAGATASAAPVTLQPVDLSGAPLTGTITLSVQLDSTHHLIITPGDISRLALDFNLAASNDVNLTNDTVTVTPVLVASLASATSAAVRVRGPLMSVDTSASTYTIDVRPFVDASGTSGQLVVHTTATTTYEINGTAYAGAAGLSALSTWLATMPSSALTIAFGTYDDSTQTFTAQNVLAGSSAQSTSLDELSGTVVARSGNTLTVRGGLFIPHGPTPAFMGAGSNFAFEAGNTTVTIGSATAVTEDGQQGSFGIADISVGQHIDAFGSMSGGANTGALSSAALTLDATAGRVRLDLTPVIGMVTQSGTGSLTLDVQSIDALPVSAFTFAGTGTSSATDATASAYVIDTGTLSLNATAAGAPVSLSGFVAPFQTAPPDFTALSLTSYSGALASLKIGWSGTGSTSAFGGLTAASTGLQPSLTGAGAEHVIAIGSERIDLTMLASPPTIVASTSASVEVFAIAHVKAGTADSYAMFASFVSALASDLNGTTPVVGLAAQGTYDTTTNVFTATRVVVLLDD